MPKGYIHLTVKNSSGNKTDSKNYRPEMNSSVFLTVLEYLPVYENQISYRPTTGCIDARSVLKETVMYYKSQRSGFNCPM